jgi:hypothetical protein
MSSSLFLASCDFAHFMPENLKIIPKALHILSTKIWKSGIIDLFSTLRHVNKLYLYWRSFKGATTLSIKINKTRDLA